MGLADQLDARRRAMLAEMGVRVWLPEAASASEAPAVSAAASAPAPKPLAPQPPMSTSHVPTSPVPTSPVSNSAAPAVSAPPVAPARTGTSVATLGWSALQDEALACRACGLCEARQQVVFGTGSHRADWLVVGEAPGEQEDRLGQPFVGPAGQLLDRMLKAMGVSRQAGDAGDGHAEGDGEGGQGHEQAQQVYITNVIKCRPPGNRNPTPQEVASCTPFLQRQIALLQPRVILAMGRFAAQALLADALPDVGTLPLGKLRGQVWRYQGLPVVVTYHPAYLLRNLPDKAKAWADLCLAMDVMDGVVSAAADGGASLLPSSNPPDA